MNLSNAESVVIKGRMSEGLKESSSFTNIPWVKEQFLTKLGIDPYPGTFNLDVVNTEDIARLKEIKKLKGIEIVPAESGFCSAKCFHVSVNGTIKGALIIPLVPDYPESKLEIISAERIRDVLSLKVDDLVLVDIFLK